MVNPQELTAFSKGNNPKDKLSYYCKSCIRRICKKRYQSITDKSSYRAWALRNPEKMLECVRKSKRKNIAKYREYNRTWQKANSGKVTAYTRKRQAQQLNATPKWLSGSQLKEIEAIYINRPKGYHVDHIVPLLGKDVCGLHVPWNLQYLTSSDNIKKSNKL